MNAFEMLLAKPVIQALGWALVHFIWQGATIALLYAGLAACLRRSANVRYSVACAAMVLMLALPIATTFIIEQSSARAVNDASLSRRALAAELAGRSQALSNETSPSAVSAFMSQSVPAASP